MAKARFASAWLLFGVSLVLQSGSNAEPVIAISGTPRQWTEIHPSYPITASWTQESRFTNVAVTASLTSYNVPDQTARAYITRLAPGATSPDEIASTMFTFPLRTNDVVLFSGLTLDPGRYDLRLVYTFSGDGAWAHGCTARVTASDGVRLRPENATTFMHFTVVAGTNAVVSGTNPPVPPPPAPLQMNMRGYSLDNVENLLTWDTVTGADRYKISRSYDRKYWDVIATNVIEPHFREAESSVYNFPVYYKVIAADASGDIAVSEELAVQASYPLARLSGVSVRPTSETAVLIQLSVNQPIYASWGDPVPGGVKAMLEIGNTAESLAWVGWSENFARTYKFAVTNLEPNTSYWYRLSVVGTNDTGFTYLNSFVTRPFFEPPAITIGVPSDSVTYLDEDTPMRFTLVTDEPFQRPPTFTIVRQPGNAGFISGTSPNFLFTPALEWDHPFTFEYSATDGISTNTGQVIVFVNPINDPPVAIAGLVWTPEDEQDTPLPLRSIDLDHVFSSTATFRVVSGPKNGTTRYDPTLGGGAIIYTPNTNFTGVDLVTVVANDGEADGNLAIMKVVVGPVNDAPIVTNQFVTVIQNTAKRIPLNASDPEGSGVGFSGADGPTHGTLSAVGIGTLPYDRCIPLGDMLYVPDQDFIGTDRFTYIVFDDPRAAMAEVTINVVPPGVRLEMTRVAGNVLLSWNEPGYTLETASNPSGPWTPLSTQSNSYTTVTSTGSQFFRLRR